MIEGKRLVERTVLPIHIQTIGNGGVALGQATTTTTGAWVVMFGPISIKIPTNYGIFSGGLSLQLGHSANAALCSIESYITQNADGTGILQYCLYQDTLYLPSSTGWIPAPAALGCDLSISKMPVGDRYLWIAGKSYTAGTLYFGQNNGSEFVKFQVEGK